MKDAKSIKQTVSAGSRPRDLTIQGALNAAIRLKHPMISDAEITGNRGRVEIHQGAWTTYIDDEPIAHVRLDGDKRFEMTLLF